MCNHQFELRQKFSDPPAERCPKCGSNVRKLVSAVSFSLKGSGWFGDGYGSTLAETTTGNEAVSETANDTTVVTPAGKEGQATDTAPPESSVAEPSTAGQVETKSQAAEVPTRDKSESTPKTD